MIAQYLWKIPRVKKKSWYGVICTLSWERKLTGAVLMMTIFEHVIVCGYVTANNSAIFKCSAIILDGTGTVLPFVLFFTKVLSSVNVLYYPFAVQ